MIQNNFPIASNVKLSSCISVDGDSKPFRIEKSYVYLGCVTEAYSCL